MLWNPKISPKTVWLVPGYKTVSLMDEIYFNTLKGLASRIEPWLSNGEYVEGLVMSSEGKNTIIYLNPNCDRVVYDYWSIIR